MLACNNFVKHTCFVLIFTLTAYKEHRPTYLLSHISSDTYVIVFLYSTDLYLPSFRQYTNLIRLHVSSWKMLQTTGTVLHQYWYNKLIKSYQYKYRFFFSESTQIREYSRTPINCISDCLSELQCHNPNSHVCCSTNVLKSKWKSCFYHTIKMSFTFVCLTVFFSREYHTSDKQEISKYSQGALEWTA